MWGGEEVLLLVAASLGGVLLQMVGLGVTWYTYKHFRRRDSAKSPVVYLTFPSFALVWYANRLHENPVKAFFHLFSEKCFNLPIDSFPIMQAWKIVQHEQPY